jgi:hypothetical protein
MHGFAVRIGAAFTETVQDSFEDVANICLHIDLLGDVESHFIEFHEVSSLRN